MATAYVPGPSLTEAVETHGPLPEASLLALAAGLAESLSAIHKAGVVHRDLKPSNVLLAEDGPRVIDFGISRAAAEATALTQTGLVVGSPGFMSPEQAMGNEVGPPSDVFNLGAVLAFAATGEGPFGTGTTAALLYRVAHGTPNLDRVPPAVRPLIEHCLDKDPAQRPTADGLLAEVGALQPAGDWLPDSFTRTFVSPVTPSGSALAASGPALAASGPALTGSGPAYAWSGPAPAASGPAPAVPGAAPDPGLVTRTTGAGSAAQATGPSQPFNAVGYGPTALSGSMPSSGASVPPYPPDGFPPSSAGPDGPRRRLGRPMLLALIIGALVLVSGAAAFALTSFSGKSPAPVKDTPAAQTFSPSASPSAVPSSSGASARPSASPGVSYPATAPSYTYQAPTATTSPSAHRSTPPTATASPSVRTSPSPSASVKTSPTAAPPSSPAPSPSATHSP
jgi:serine/threonine protein kinase